jgi:hypothetical protein
MRKVCHKLFQDLKLENAEIIRVVGGIGTTTSNSSDTNLTNGSGHDIAYDSKDSDGKVFDVNIALTGRGDKDKPESNKLQNYTIQG